ncbi:MAG: GNAT family N-acetyltransferase, partial [Ilumatobacteraceae bacterium]
ATLHVARLGSTVAARIVRIYVTPLARRVGVGDALISAAKEHARQRGCGRIDALSLPGDRDTKNLYERNGLTARLIVASSPL